nr:MAG TPA: hypothetical protein [Caudoviricetes sp.]
MDAGSDGCPEDITKIKIHIGHMMRSEAGYDISHF